MDNLPEIWKDIENFPNYEISSKGKVRSLINSKKRILKYISSSGYDIVSLQRNGRQIHKLIHRLMYLAFVSSIPDNYVIHHINEDRQDNELSNLQAMSNSDHSKLHSIGRQYGKKDLFSSFGCSTIH